VNDASLRRSFSTASRARAVLVRLGGIEPGEHHRLHLLEAGKRVAGRARGVREGIADLRVRDLLQPRDHDDADLSRTEGVDLHAPGGQHLERVHLDFLAGRDEPHAHPGAHLPVEHAHQHHRAVLRLNQLSKTTPGAAPPQSPRRRDVAPDRLQEADRSPLLCARGTACEHRGR
jgi:hypothetical protein